MRKIVRWMVIVLVTGALACNWLNSARNTIKHSDRSPNSKSFRPLRRHREPSSQRALLETGFLERQPESPKSKSKRSNVSTSKRLRSSDNTRTLNDASTSTPISTAVTTASNQEDNNPLSFLANALNYVPKKLGVEYNNNNDNYIGAAGNAALAYGAYNSITRDNDVENLSRMLVSNFKTRQSFVNGIQKQISSLEGVSRQLQSATYKLGSTKSTLSGSIRDQLNMILNSDV